MSDTITRTNGTDANDEAVPWILMRAAERRRENQSTADDGVLSDEADADEAEVSAPVATSHRAFAAQTMPARTMPARTPIRTLTTGAEWQVPPPPLTTRAYSPPPPPPPREWDSEVDNLRAYEPVRPYTPPPPPPGSFGISRPGRGLAIAASVVGAVISVVLVPLVLLVAFGSAAPDRTPATFTAADGRFTAEFPGSPDRQEETVSESGIDAQLVFYQVDTNDYSLGVGYADLPAVPDEARGALLVASANGSADEVEDGVIQSNTAVTYLGLPARDVVVTSPDGTLYGRVLLVDNRLYVLMVVAEDTSPVAYERLLATFSLT